MRILIVALALVAFSAHAETMVANNGKDTIRLWNEPCKTPDVVKRLREEYREQFQRADGDIDSETFQGCWILHGSDVYLMWNDGDKSLLPMTDFKPDGV